MDYRQEHVLFTMHSGDRFRLIIASVNQGSRGFKEMRYEALNLSVHLSLFGPFSLAIGGRQWDLDGPWLWTGYPGPRFRFVREAKPAPWQDYFFQISGDLPRQWMKSGLMPRHPRPVQRIGEATAAAAELVGLHGAADGVRGRLAANLLERLLLMVDEEPVAAFRPAWFDELERQVGSEPSWQPDWKEVARQCRLSRSAFRNLFQRITDRPPQRWLIDRRIATARTLLESGMRVAAVAQRLGYSDPFFFSRQFHVWTGSAPSVYARGEVT